MNTNLLSTLITRYLTTASDDADLAEQHSEHRRRIERAARILTVEHIPYLTREEWVELLRDTDASRGNPWAKNTFWIQYYPEGAELPEELRQGLLDLLRRAEAGLTVEDFNAAIASLPNIGPAYLSELLALRFPDRYWMLNRVVREFLAILGVDLREELPHGKKGNDGEQYMLAGRYLSEVRKMLASRSLAERKGLAVDFMETDLFIWWVTEHEEPDIWRGKVTGTLRDAVPEIRVDARRRAEEQARRMIDARLGSFTPEDIHALLRHVNTDLYEGRERYDRFMPALYGSLANKIDDDPGAFNRWLSELWHAEDAMLDEVLDRFWKLEEIRGAGISLPTMILYLRDPEQYAIWLPVMEEGLRVVTNFTPGRRRTAAGYRIYNEAAQNFRRRYDLPPQTLDVVLWRIAKDAGAEIVPVGEDPEEEIERYTFEQLCGDTYLEERFWSTCKALMTDKRQIILYGPPGTGKTYVARLFAQHWIQLAEDPRGEMCVVQFHPSYAYEEFVEGIRPLSVERPGGGMDLSYEVRPGVFRSFCEKAERNPGRNYVIILDEINRGEIARIFGELLYLLEYRSQKVTLPYSGAQFAIPNNLFVIGTMNSADRSIALVDHALRRRFHFVPMRPSAEALRAYHESRGNRAMARMADLLDLANNQLTRDGIEWHLHIGHSHMMSPELDETRLKMIWEHSIFPTLEEYFYRQSDRIQAYHLDALLAELGEPG